MSNPPAVSDNQEFVKAKTTVFRLLRFRPRSEKELRDKLRAKDISTATLERTIEYFKQIQIIDDRQFAQGWINSRLNKPFGLNRIKIELKQKGIDEETFKAAAARATEEYDELSVINALAKKRLTRYPGVEKNKSRRRLTEYLLRRGFAQRNIHQALRRLFGPSHDDSE